MKKEILVELNDQELEAITGGEYEVIPPDWFVHRNADLPWLISPIELVIIIW